MKKLILVGIILFGLSLFGQNSQKEIDTTFISGSQKTIIYKDGSQHISLVKFNYAPSKTNTSKRGYDTPQDEIEVLKQYIKSIETKVAFVKTDPIENPKANKNGWYSEMNKFIDESKARISLLEMRINNKN